MRSSCARQTLQAAASPARRRKADSPPKLTSCKNLPRTLSAPVRQAYGSHTSSKVFLCPGSHSAHWSSRVRRLCSMHTLHPLPALQINGKHSDPLRWNPVRHSLAKAERPSSQRSTLNLRAPATSSASPTFVPSKEREAGVSSPLDSPDHARSPPTLFWTLWRIDLAMAVLAPGGIPAKCRAVRHLIAELGGCIPEHRKLSPKRARKDAKKREHGEAVARPICPGPQDAKTLKFAGSKEISVTK